MKIFKIMVLCLLLSSPAYAIDADSDSNGALDHAIGGTNATTFVGATSNIYQTQDSVAIKIYGYDDMVGDWGSLYLTSSGYMHVDASKGYGFKENGTVIFAIDAGQMTMYDNIYLSFGSASNYKIKFNATSTKLEITGGQINVAGGISAGVAEIVQSATDTLSVQECRNTIINNYGQLAANTQTLPTAESGLSGMVIIGTSGAGALHLKAGANDKIYLDGTALDDADKVSLAAPVVGDYFNFFAFKTGATSYDWVVCSGAQGVLTDGGP